MRYIIWRPIVSALATLFLVTIADFPAIVSAQDHPQNEHSELSWLRHGGHEVYNISAIRGVEKDVISEGLEDYKNVSSKAGIGHQRNIAETDAEGGALKRVGRRILHSLGHVRKLLMNWQTLEWALEMDEINELTRQSKAKKFREWRPGHDWIANPMTNANQSPKVAIVTTTWAKYEQLRQWISYHRIVGVCRFYIFIDSDKATVPAKIVSNLEKHEDVVVFDMLSKELRDLTAKSIIRKEPWMEQLSDKECKFRDRFHENLNIEVAVQLALQDKMQWIIHLTAFELLHPVGPGFFSIQRILKDVDRKVDGVLLDNHEGLPEMKQIENPFTQVTLFRRNDAHLPFEIAKEAERVKKGNPHHFTSYHHGRSIARVHKGLQPYLSHRWKSTAKPTLFRLERSKHGGILHYAHCRLVDVFGLFKNCECDPDEDFIDECFIYDWEKEAYMFGKTRNRLALNSWFEKHRFWSDKFLNKDMLGAGIFLRTYEAQLIVTSLLDEEENMNGSQDAVNRSSALSTRRARTS